MSIITFLDRLKDSFRHKTRLYSRVEMQLLKYFMQNGTFYSLHYALLEEANAARYKAITYKDEMLEYQWSWRTVPAKIDSHIYQ